MTQSNERLPPEVNPPDTPLSLEDNLPGDLIDQILWLVSDSFAVYGVCLRWTARLFRIIHRGVPRDGKLQLPLWFAELASGSPPELLRRIDAFDCGDDSVPLHSDRHNYSIWEPLTNLRWKTVIPLIMVAGVGTLFSDWTYFSDERLWRGFDPRMWGCLIVPQNFLQRRYVRRGIYPVFDDEWSKKGPQGSPETLWEFAVEVPCEFASILNRVLDPWVYAYAYADPKHHLQEDPIEIPIYGVERRPFEIPTFESEEKWSASAEGWTLMGVEYIDVPRWPAREQETKVGGDWRAEELIDNINHDAARFVSDSTALAQQIESSLPVYHGPVYHGPVSKSTNEITDFYEDDVFEDYEDVMKFMTEPYCSDPGLLALWFGRDDRPMTEDPDEAARQRANTLDKLAEGRRGATSVDWGVMSDTHEMLKTIIFSEADDDDVDPVLLGGVWRTGGLRQNEARRALQSEEPL